MCDTEREDVCVCVCLCACACVFAFPSCVCVCVCVCVWAEPVGLAVIRACMLKWEAAELEAGAG